MNRETIFSYSCHGCGRCCHYKRIQVNPYEILRLARHHSVTAGEFIRNYLENDGPYLRNGDDGACIFLDGKGCSVHADRPLVCRLYPLGRRLDANGEESFLESKPHPQSEGVYGRGGTIMQFLEQQGALPYMEVTDRYQALFYRLFDALQQKLKDDPELSQSTRTFIFESERSLPFAEWLDAEETAKLYCKENGLQMPSEPAAVADLHIAAIDLWLDALTGDDDEQKK